MDGNIEKMQSLTGRIKGLGIDKTLTKKGMCAEAEATGKALATKVSITDIVDDLLSVATDKPLSANQGRILKKQIDEIDPHYAENVLYNDTNVKDALDKVSNAENIAYDGDKSVRGAIDEVSDNVADVQTQINGIQTEINPIASIFTNNPTFPTRPIVVNNNETKEFTFAVNRIYLLVIFNEYNSGRLYLLQTGGNPTTCSLTKISGTGLDANFTLTPIDKTRLSITASGAIARVTSICIGTV